jgi:hypothetical protein
MDKNMENSNLCDCPNCKSCDCPNCKSELKINDCHSSITEYPIDYGKFPLAKNCEIHKVELVKNQYLFIPKGWFHWVFTEPNTLSVHYKINKINFSDKNNEFFNSLKNNMPFYKTIYLNYNISYKDFINKSLNYSYRAIFSETDDCIPVQKNKTKKFFHENLLKNIIDITIANNYYTYIGNHKIEHNNVINKYNNIDNIIDPNIHNGILYEPSVWFTLNKRVNSGLHCDTTPNIINVLDGKKTIYLISPKFYHDLYINEHELIKTI